MKKHSKIIIYYLVFYSCGHSQSIEKRVDCNPSQMPKYDYRATVNDGEMTPQIDSILRIEKRRDVFKPCRTSVYNAKFYAKTGELLSSEFISVTPTGQRWEYQTEKQDEIIIKYSFNEDSIKNINNYQLNKAWITDKWFKTITTGVIENVESIWTHPFRSNQYNFTQVAPFPQVELPLKIGKKWSDDKISLKEGFGDWTNMNVNSTFEVIENSNINTSFGNIHDCWKIRGISEFPLGKSELIYWFNHNLGFVKLIYLNYGGQKLEIDLVEIKLQ